MAKEATITIGVLALQGAFKEHIELLRQASRLNTSKKTPTQVRWRFIEVRSAEELWQCDAMIIPGGESTTMSLVAERSKLLEPLRDFVKQVAPLSNSRVAFYAIYRKPVWGTCAGLILLAESATRTKKGGQELIGGLDVRVNRNHFGRQVESFEADLDLPFLVTGNEDDERKPFKGIFIRAPVVETILPARELGHNVDEEEELGSVTAPSRKPKDERASELAQGKVEVLGMVPRRAKEVPSGAPMAQSVASKQDIVAVKQGNVFGTSFHPELSGDPRIHSWWLGEVLDMVEMAQLD